jgi:hypothetical protein
MSDNCVDCSKKSSTNHRQDCPPQQSIARAADPRTNLNFGRESLVVNNMRWYKPKSEERAPPMY